MNTTEVNIDAFDDTVTLLFGADALEMIVKLYRVIDDAERRGFENGQVAVMNEAVEVVEFVREHIEDRVDDAYEDGYADAYTDGFQDGIRYNDIFDAAFGGEFIDARDAFMTEQDNTLYLPNYTGNLSEAH